MEIAILEGDLTKQEVDLVVVNLFEEVDELGGATSAVDQALNGLLKQEIEDTDFKAKLGKTLQLRATDDAPFARVMVVGLGKRDAFDADTVRQAAAATIKQAQSFGVNTIASVMHGAGAGDLDVETVGQAMVEGMRLAAYQFTRYKAQEESDKAQDKLPETVKVVSTDSKAVEAAKTGAEIGELTARGTMFTRDLVNTPGQHMKPIELVEAAKEIAQDSDMIEIEVFDRDQLEEMGAGGILGVSQGSEHPPYLVHMTYTPEKAKKKVALVGKAITFDTGGLSLKPSKGMESMKLDMGGAGSVLGACSVLGELQPDVEVHAIFGAAENMVSGKAMRPGDVITIMNGKTVEVLNTDAEGRLTLADALTYAQKQDPDLIIDLATLTGACLVALGEEIAGVMGHDDDLIDNVLGAAKTAGEKCWELPLEKRYKKQLESPIADYKNIGGRYGGALTAGLFLQGFVDDEMPWVHIDLAGPSFAEKPLNNYTKKGATGFGVRTLLTFLSDIK